MKHLFFTFFIIQILFSQKSYKPEDTEVWDPEPAVVVPGEYAAPPSDAIILFTIVFIIRSLHIYIICSLQIYIIRSQHIYIIISQKKYKNE